MTVSPTVRQLVVTRAGWISSDDAGTVDTSIVVFVLELQPVQAFAAGEWTERNTLSRVDQGDAIGNGYSARADAPKRAKLFQPGSAV